MLSTRGFKYQIGDDSLIVPNDVGGGISVWGWEWECIHPESQEQLRHMSESGSLSFQASEPDSKFVSESVGSKSIFLIF